MARFLIGKQSYKSDNKQKQTLVMQSLRQEMIRLLRSQISKTKYSLDIAINNQLALDCIDDASGDTLDAVMATIQAAKAYRQLNLGIPDFGIPEGCDRLEGWICAL
jgi:hypothetical protein